MLGGGVETTGHGEALGGRLHVLNVGARAGGLHVGGLDVGARLHRVRRRPSLAVWRTPGVVGSRT